MKTVINLSYYIKLYKKYFLLVLLFYCTPFISTCNYLTEPEPFVNKNMKLPEYGTYSQQNFSNDQVVGGIISIPFIPNSNASKIERVDLFIDSTLVATKEVSPFLFSINTKNWISGRHILSFYVYKNDTSLGLLELINSPSQIYTLPLIFDNTPPVPPTNFQVRKENNQANLSWTPTNSTNFYAYVIRRNGQIIDSIYIQSDSIFIDESFVLSDYFQVAYEIGTCTMGDIAYSSQHTLSQGESLKLQNVTKVVDGLDDKVIFHAQNLVSISTNDGKVIAQYNINPCEAMAANLKGSSLIYLSNNKIYTFNINTLQLIGFQQLYLSNSINAIYAVGGLDSCMFVSAANGDLFIYYYGTIGLWDREFDPPATFLGISPDEKLLFEGDKRAVKKYSLRINNGLPPPSINLINQSRDTDLLDLFKVDWKSSKLYVKRNDMTIEEWDTDALGVLKSYGLPNTEYELNEIITAHVNSQNLYVVYSTKLNNNDASLLIEYDLASGQLIRTWLFSFHIQSLFGSEHGRYLFACTKTDQWLVDLGDDN